MSAADESTFVPGTTPGTPMMGISDNDTTPDQVAAGTLAAVPALTRYRAQHVNQRNSSGVEIDPRQDNGPAWTTDKKVTTSADATGGVDISNAPTGGQKIVVDDLIVSVGSTAMTLTFEEETSGTDELLIYAAANTVLQVTPRAKWKLATADKKLRLTASAAGNVSVRAQFHSEA